MEEDPSHNTWVGYVITAVVVFFFLKLVSGPDKYEGQTAEEWFNDYDYCEAQVEKANQIIEEAQYYQNGDFWEIREALENPEVVNGC